MSLFNYQVDGDTIKSILDILERHRPKLALATRVDLKRLPLPRPATDRVGRAPLTVQQVRLMLRMSEQGSDQFEIAHAIGCSQGAVSKRLLRMGIRTNRFARRRRVA
jgi:hypothetical protein